MPYLLPEYRGEYKMEGRLGESGSGPVYSARDAFGRALAIKVWMGPSDPELPDRLQGETNLKHKNILTILALFRNKERICIVTELLEGRNLAELMTEDPSLSLLEKIEIMTQAGEALRYAHANGIVHRGLKPSRIHVQPDGAVKVGSLSVDLPAEAAQYMPPEQRAGHVVDALGNIFTYGVILQELRANSQNCPRLLTSIIERALSEDRESRYRNFDELLADAARLLVQLRNTDLHFTGLFESFSPPGPEPAQTPSAGTTHERAGTTYEKVRFTVYRPRAVRPGEWKTLLAYAHLSERPADAPEDDPDPIQDVQPRDIQQRADQILGKDAAQYRDFPRNGGMPIPHENELTFVPQMNGIEFNPRRVSFLWQESVHQAAFRLRASPRMDGQTVRGQMCVYWGSILVAQVALKIEVNGQRIFQAAEEQLAPVTVARYRKIFASYSHKDVALVEELERYGQATGDEYLRDVIHLRSGEAWNDRLAQMIDRADVFQLFWSSSSIRSPRVRQEWQHALTLNRDYFVRPVYWEDPLPEIRELNLPPEELRGLRFHRVVLSHVPATPETAAPAGAFAMAGPAVAYQAPPAAASVPGQATRLSTVPPPSTWKPPSVPPLPSSYAPAPQIGYAPARQTNAPKPGLSSLKHALKWAAAVLIAVGVGALVWYGLRSRKPAPGQIETAANPPALAPEPTADIAPAAAPEPTVGVPPIVANDKIAQEPAAGIAKRYTLMLWSRGAAILPDQVIRGDDPFLQSSFALDGPVPADASVEVEWYLNGVSSGVTDFDPSEKEKHKSYTNPPRDGNYRAVLLVNRQAVTSLSFSYRK
jgi:hypothetical protein